MSFENEIEVINVNADNIDETGFFCYMSKKKSEGYRKKANWLKARFGEGMRLKVLKLPERGFIEYIPGEYAWRSVQCEGYMFIHCLWVVGRSKGRGLAGILLDQCLADAKKAGLKGVAMVVSEGNGLIGKRFLTKSGFKSVDKAAPSFELMVKKFARGPNPSFTGDWDKKAARYPKGLAIFRSDQCPYNEDAVKMVANTATELGIEARIIELEDSGDIRKYAPSAYGTFDILMDGVLMDCRFTTKRQFLKKLETLRKK